jgi:hypothetical protein
MLTWRRRRARSRPQQAEPAVRVTPEAGGPALVTVQTTGPEAAVTVGIEPHPGAAHTTIEKVLQ